MKKFVLFTLLTLGSLIATAQGWKYDPQKAMLVSSEEFLSGDFDNPTCLGIAVGKIHGKDCVMIGLYGEYDCHDFRKNQQYIVVNFDRGKNTRWKIKEKDDTFFFIVDATRFIQQLTKCNMVSITLPVYDYGKKEFYFSADGYPLDYDY